MSGSPAASLVLGRWGAPLAIALAVFAVYSNALDGPFFLDDVSNIVENPAIRRVWPLTTALNPPPVDMTFCTRPFINLTMCVDYAIGGLRVRSYHVTSLLFHLAASLSLLGLFGLALRASGYDPRESRLLALFGALAWAMHPLATSAVNTLSQRPEVAVGFFFFLTLYSLHRSTLAGARRTTWQAVAFGACLLGMGSKESMAAAPVLALVYDRIFLSASWKEVFRARGWFYVLLAGTWIWPISRQLAFSPHTIKEGAEASVYWRYPLTQAWGLVQMLRLYAWPTPLVMDYGVNMFSRLGQVWPQALVMALLAVLTLYALRRHPRTGFPAFCFFALVAPSSSFLPIVGQPVAEHRVYAAMAAPAILAVLGLHKALGRLIVEPASRRRALLTGLLAAWTLALGLASHRRNAVYQDAVRLWQDTASKRPTSERAWLNLGNALSAKGMYEKALGAYQKAIRINPRRVEAQGNLANALCALGHHEAALPYYREAIRLNAAYAPARSSLGSALNALGQHEEALVQHKRALRLMPDSAEVQFKMANACAVLGRHEEAVAHFQKAIELQPQAVEFRNNLGNSLKALRRYDEAVACYQEILHRQAGSIPAAGNLGLTWLEMGFPDRALGVFMEAAQRSGQPGTVLFDFSSVLIGRGYLAEGLALSERVLATQPHHPLALNNAAWIMATATNEALRNGPRAAEYAQRAVELLGRSSPAAWATLAAAQAEAGHFDEATATARLALDMVRENNDAGRIAQYEARLEAYQQGRAWRDEGSDR